MKKAVIIILTIMTVLFTAYIHENNYTPNSAGMLTGRIEYERLLGFELTGSSSLLDIGQADIK